MSEFTSYDSQLDTTGGKFPLYDYRLKQGDREWSILHTGAVLTEDDETHAIVLKTNRLPYGVSLWPAAIALSHEIATRAAQFRGKRVLELGSGTGLPGIVAASLGAQVLQTDHDEVALHLCRRNGERNGIPGIEYRQSDWTAWEETGQYDWIIGADILYSERLHPPLLHIFDVNLAPGGKLLIADPFRGNGLMMMQTLEKAGWDVRFNQWDVGEDKAAKTTGVFELTPPPPPPPVPPTPPPAAAEATPPPEETPPTPEA